MPEQPATVQLPKVPEWAIELTKSVKEGFARVEERLDNVETNLDLQGATVRDVAKRMTSLEERTNVLENARTKNSERAKGESAVNLKQDAAIANIITTQETHGTALAALQAEQAKNNAWTKELVDDGRKFFAKHPEIGNALAVIILGVIYVIAKKLGVSL